MQEGTPEYSTQQVKELECPFCGAKIKALYKPSMLQYHVSRIASRTARVAYRTNEKYILVSNKCPNCGKTKSEIEKRLKEGKQPSREEIIRRAREAGLPLKF